MDTKTTMELVAEGKRRIQNLSPDGVACKLEDPEVVLVDLREPAELAEQGSSRERSTPLAGCSSAVPQPADHRHARAHVLTKLGCRSRTEATRRAGELGLLEGHPKSAPSPNWW